jgi:hypothetical protein
MITTNKNTKDKDIAFLLGEVTSELRLLKEAQKGNDTQIKEYFTQLNASLKSMTDLFQSTEKRISEAVLKQEERINSIKSSAMTRNEFLNAGYVFDDIEERKKDALFLRKVRTRRESISMIVSPIFMKAITALALTILGGLGVWGYDQWAIYATSHHPKKGIYSQPFEPKSESKP